MFSKNYTGDTKALAVITQTINKKQAIIPGVTVNMELSGLVQAAVAEFYYNLAPAVGETTAGAHFSTDNKGSKKAVLPLTRALQIDEEIPRAAVDTTSASVVYDRLAKGSIALSNRLGAKFLASLELLAQDKTIVADNFFDAIVDAQLEFSSANSVNVGGVADTTYSNKENGIEPNSILVGDKGRAGLFKTEQFQRVINATGTMPNLIGTMLGLDVVYAKDLDADFMLVYAEGVAFPYSINTLRVVRAEGFEGVRVQGEIAYADHGYGILPIDSHAIKFTVEAPSGT